MLCTSLIEMICKFLESQAIKRSALSDCPVDMKERVAISDDMVYTTKVNRKGKFIWRKNGTVIL